jgi:HK97 family phage prohead protease
MLLYKDASSSPGASIKDVDAKTGTVTGYFSVFGNVDSDGDIVMPGAFTRTLNNNYKRVKHLAYHDPNLPLAATKKENLLIKEDPHGLYFESKISQTSYGKDIIQLYQDGVLDEHSIGYEVVRSRDSDTQTTERWGQKVPVKELHELKLWEGSTVTWGANSKAGTESVKSMTLSQVIEKHDKILKAIKNGKYESDDIFEMLELYFKQLERQFEILSTQPAAKAPDPLLKTADELDEGLILIALETKLLTA